MNLKQTRGAILSVMLVVISLSSFAQNKTLGVGTPTPNANAALHVESPTNNQGIIIPRLTTAQRTSFTGALAGTDIGLIVFDTDLRALTIWNGASWDVGSKVGEPITATNAATSGNAGTFTLNNAANNDVAINGTTIGTGHAGYFEINNASNANAALFVGTNGSGNAITANGTVQASSFVGDGSALTGISGFTLPYSQSAASAGALFNIVNTGTGFSSLFQINNATNSLPSLASETNGLGSAGEFGINNVANSSPVLTLTTNGTGQAINANAPIQATAFIGDGSALTNLSSIGWGLSGNTGTLAANNFVGTIDKNDVVFRAENIEAMRILTNGNLSLTSFGSAPKAIKVSDGMSGENGGNLVVQGGNGGAFGPGVSGGDLILKGGNSWNGGGSGTSGKIQLIAGVNTLSNDNLQGIEFFTGEDGSDNPIQRMIIDATGKVGIGQNSPTAKLDVNTDVFGPEAAASFFISNSANSSDAVKAVTVGFGSAGTFQIGNSSNSLFAVRGTTTGGGGGGEFEVTNAASPGIAVKAATNGTGPALQVDQNNNGLALDVLTGGLKYSVLTISSLPATLTQKVGVVHVTVGSGTLTFSNTGRVNGETIILTAGANALVVTNLGSGGAFQVTLNANTVRTFIFVNGYWVAEGMVAL